MEKIGEFLKDFLDKNEIALNNNYSSFFKSWDKIAGEPLSHYTKVKDISKNQLIIEVTHPGWLQMFQFKEKKILNSLEKNYPELKIKAVKLVLVEKRETKKTGEKEEVIADETVIEPDKQIFESIKNTDLKNKLKKLYNSALKNNLKSEKNIQ